MAINLKANKVNLFVSAGKRYAGEGREAYVIIGCVLVM
jgi:hypothetical protein